MADRNFERALRSAARRGRTAGACPDAATLAAFVDRSLSWEEYATVEAHVADCTACTEHLALVAALDAPEESALPAPAIDVVALVRRWGWLVPALTAVLVVAVWLRSSDQRPADASLPSVNRSSDQARVEPRRDVAAPSDRYASLSDANEPQAKRDRPAGAGGRKKTDAPARPTAPASAVADAAKPASPAAQAEAVSGDAKQLDKLAADDKNKERAEPQAPAAAAPPPPAAMASPAADAREEAALKIVPEPVIGGAAATARMRKAVRQESAATAGTVLVRTASGRIDRSTDGGQSWTNEYGRLTDRIRVTLCPTASACWLGADNGAVLVRAADGQWVRRVVPPPAAAVQRIIALDNQHATVELADGRRYMTTNGGITWTIPPAQP
jgi:Putative zinc-finger